MGEEHNGKRTADRRQKALRAQSARANEANGVAGDRLLTVAEAGEYLGTGERFVRRLITERRISYVKLGKYVRLQRSILDSFIDAGRVPSTVDGTQ